jgi:hypothetical protein
MPYTTGELENVDFYQEFVQQLRTKYLAGMAALSENDFRKDNVLYSFEDIFTGLGIEDVDVNNSLYRFLITTIPGAPPIDRREKQFTVNNFLQKKYIKTNNLENIIDRNISELAESTFAKELPDGIVNGDVVKNEIANDSRKWFIENNQKRIFLNTSAFFGNEHKLIDLKTLYMLILDNIPNGDPIT